ncbi:MAG: SpoIVB peptidase S55 domain-containing protein [bacterium]|nr:SpoIVB peptidase S55 domain-containing protein [bacterium]
MKKLIITFFIILFLPMNILAYSKNVIPGGESIGININTDGLIVVGFYKVNDEYIAKETIKIGDRIIQINNNDVNTIEQLSDVIDKSILENKEVSVKIIRNNKQIDTYLRLEKDNDIYKTGLYVKDSVIGLGTLTYIDPISKIYGALGHEILLSETEKRVEIKNGNILMSNVTSINKSRNGYVGSKNANILYNDIIGTIEKNTNKGIFGIYTSSLPNKNLIQIGEYSSIEKGDAHILTVTKNNIVNKYKIKILDKYNNKKDTQKAFSFEIIDEELINKTGGVVQGMSGSPIIQNNRIIGAVTNVLVDDVKIGYGISIITMLEEGER